MSLPSNDISAKIHELETTMDHVAKQFQQKEVDVQNLTKSIEQSKASIKAIENQIQEATKNIERFKEEKRELERVAMKAQVDLNKAKQDLVLLQNENRRHGMELERFKGVLETASRAMSGKDGKRAA